MGEILWNGVDTIQLAGVSEVALLEDIVALELLEARKSEENSTKKVVLDAMWNGRANFSNLARPPKLNGNILNVQVSPIEPLELAELPLNWGPKPIRFEIGVHQKGLLINFLIKSSASRVPLAVIVGDLLRLNPHRSSLATSDGSTAVHRFVSKPAVVEADYIRALTDKRVSTENGRTIFIKNAKHPTLSGDMHGK